MAVNDYPVRFKDPDAKARIVVNWEDWLEAENDSISASNWIVPPPLTVHGAGVNGFRCFCIIGGGAAGKSYLVTNRITTAGGLVDDQTVRLRIEEM